MKSRARGCRVASVLAFALTALIWGAGCGGDSDRDRVEAYLDDANAVQRRSAPAFKRANDVYKRFSTGDLRASRAAAELARAERAIRSARAKLAALDPPPEAAELHRRLLRVYDLNAGLARESTQLARYLPAAAAALRPLTAINRRLESGLGSAPAPEGQGRALGRYADDLRTVVARLEALRPPPLLEATDRARVRRLAATRSLAARLRDAIEERDSRRVARLLLRFRRVTGSGRSEPTFAGPSLRAYNRRYREVFRASAAAQQERARIERSL